MADLSTGAFVDPNVVRGFDYGTLEPETAKQVRLITGKLHRQFGKPRDFVWPTSASKYQIEHSRVWTDRGVYIYLPRYEYEDITPQNTNNNPCAMVVPNNYPPKGKYVVYALIDPRKSEIFYIGKTNQFYLRMRQHTQISHLAPISNPYGDHRLNYRKIKIFNAGFAVIGMPLNIYDDNHSASKREAELIGAYKNDLLNKVQSIYVEA